MHARREEWAIVHPATLEQMRDILEQMEPGQHVTMNYDVYAQFFPPGEPSDEARRRAEEFAKKIGCRIENRPNTNEFVFIKEGGADHGG